MPEEQKDQYDDVAEFLMNGEHYLPTPAGSITKNALAKYLRDNLSGAVAKIAKPGAFEPPLFVVRKPGAWGIDWYVGAQLTPGGPIDASLGCVGESEAWRRVGDPETLGILRQHADASMSRHRDLRRGSGGGGYGRDWIDRKLEKYGAPAPKPAPPKRDEDDIDISHDLAGQINKDAASSRPPAEPKQLQTEDFMPRDDEDDEDISMT